MKRSTWKKRALASALALTMAASVLPTAGFAAGGSTVPLAGETGTEGLKMNKTAKLEEDGTYTINLEAYATGQVKIETVKTVKPCDIVLVLDQSGSMVQERISGIPGNTYKQINGLTNADVENGIYYYQVDGNYYRLYATKKVTGVETVWKDKNGNTYTDGQVINTWNRAYDGQTYTTSSYFVADSLKTFTRDHKTTLGFINTFWYVKDGDGSETSRGAASAKGARDNFSNAYKTQYNTVEFHNDGAPSNGDTDMDDNYYVAAVYTPVSKESVYTYEYTYTYVDEAGQNVTVKTATGTEADPCPVSPLYERETTTGTRLQALKYAANTFINNIRANAIANDVDHRVAVVGFGSTDYSSSYYWNNTELFVGANQYNFTYRGQDSTHNNYGDLAADHYTDAYQTVTSNEGYRNLEASIKNLSGNGATHPEYGFKMADGIFTENDDTYIGHDGTEQTRSKVVIFLTDGEPGDTEYESSVARDAIIEANGLKTDHNAKVYTVAVLNKEPSDNNVDQFLKDTSSSNSYTLATNAQDLEDFFETVDEDISNTTTNVELTENAKMVDELSEYFIFPEGYNVDENVSIQVAKHTGYEAFAPATDAPEGVQARLNSEKNAIEITGFNFVSEGQNLVTTDDTTGGSVKATGYKLIVTIHGVLAKDAAAGQGYISTNSDRSGIYDLDDDNEYAMIKAFNKPLVLLTESLRVLDYAKEAQLPVDGLTSVNRLDSSEDDVFSKVGEDSTELDLQYGDAVASDAKLTYQPQTMNWNGYDTFYALGGTGRENQWSKVSVMPANNVYYEDDFVTNSQNGTVGIEYGGAWTVDGTPSGNTETPNNGVHGGWVKGDAGLSNDTGYSDGSAHKATGSATATFTFTGTGVDIYSRTNLTTGTVLARLVDNNDNEDSQTQTMIVNNKAESDDYYQIPTLTFAKLPYGNYTVTITVTSATGTYYLDGIRVYNPIQRDPDVDAAYGNEVGAVFQSVRDILLDSGKLTADVDEANGVVFIDKDESQTETTTNVIGTYKDYGPKNEVYLAKNQSIGFKLNNFTQGTAYIGLKVPAGDSTTVEVTNGAGKSNLTINHSTDLYYEVTPNADGLVVIKNTGDSLLSITKLRTTANSGVGETDLASLMSYMAVMDTLPEVPYVDEDSDGSEDGGNVDIENPDQGQETPNQGNSFLDILKDIFESIWNWF